MSWLGVNLNDSISSIKGQISSLTRDVLTENSAEADHVDVLVPKKRIKEYESSIFLYQEEIKELKTSKAEFEERLRAQDYNHSAQIASLTKQLNETQEQLQNLKAKSSEWKWDESSEDSKKQFSVSNKEDASFYLEKISFLQRQLVEEKRRREDDILALQKANGIESQNNKGKDAKNQRSSTFTNIPLSDDYIETEKDRKIKELEEELYNLRSDHESLFEEKEQLNANMVDLDNQHQMIIEEILKSKKALTEELRESRNEVAELKNLATQVNSQDLQNTNDWSQRVEIVTKEKEGLIQHINNLRNEQSASIEKIEEFEEIFNLQNEKINELSRTVSDYRKKLIEGSDYSSSLVKNLEDVNALKNKLENELFNCKTALENSQKDFEELRKHSYVLQDHEMKAKEAIKELNEQIQFKEEEILKFQAVVEEKTIEHMNTFRTLKQHEEMTRITIKDFQKEIQDLKTENKGLEEKLQRQQDEEGKNDLEISKYDGIIKELIGKCSIQKFEDLPSALSEMNSEIASLRCERDRLSEDLKDTQVIVDTLETEKIDLEKECEDLRDQLEELQCGERVVPEGSLTPRSLPTIKEEEDVVQSSTQLEGENENCRSIENRTVEGKGDSELIERINELNSQVAALSEARQNLEMELSFVKKEKSETDQRLSESLSRLGNLSNLEAEAVNLRHENKSLQNHLNNVNKRLENVGYVQEEKVQLEKQIQQMSEAAQRMSLDSSHTYTDDEVDFMRASLEEQINAQNRSINDYKEEVFKLKSYVNTMNNTTDNNAHLQEKVVQLETELDKAKSTVIYKEDQIDDLKRAVEQIGSIFQLSGGCDMRQTYVQVKQIYDSLVTKLKDSNTELLDLKKEMESFKKENMRINNNENEVIQKLTADIQFLKSELSSSKNETERVQRENESGLKKYIENIGDLKVQCEILQNEKGSLISKLELQQEEERTLQNQLKMISEKNTTLQSSIQSNDEIIKKLETEFSAKENSLNNKIKSLEHELVSKVEKSNEESLKSLEEHFKESMETLKKENEELQSQLADLKTERLRMIETSTLKHQESVTYYNEIQRLNEIIRKEEQRKSQEISALNEKLREITNEKEKVLLDLNALKLNFETKLKESLSKPEAQRLQEDCNRMNQEIIKLNEELKKQQESYKIVFKERDHLRMANSSFNTQYEEKSREVAALLEKEKHLTQEVQRLKQHLVEVEETYTNEAVKSEQREASLRQSLAKMHEKISSHSTHYSNENQKTAAQLESIQEELDEAIHERDEARAQLLVVQESSEQHQEALTRLQNVLQDFQKNQTREINLATEREKRRLEEEKKRNTELELQLRMVNARHKELESTVATTSSLRDELQAKEDTIVALKSQVNAVNVAAKKSQEQVALLQSSSDAKVDKHLLRNLFVGYFATPTDKQREVLRIVAEVLDFSPEERARSGLDQQPGSWLTSVANFLAPPPSNIRVSSKVDLLDHSSLSQAFIRFLEEESSPKTHATLPAVQMAEEAHQKAQKKVQAKNNSLGNNILDSVLTMNPNLSSTPSSTEASNSLLFSNTSSLQGNFPLISMPAVSNAPISSTTTTEEIPTTKFLHNLLNPNDNIEGTGSGS